MVVKCEVNSDSASAMQNVISKYFSMVPLRESSDFLYSYSAHRDFFRKTKGGRNADLSKYPRVVMTLGAVCNRTHEA